MRHISFLTLAVILSLSLLNQQASAKEAAMIANGSQVQIHFQLTVDGQLANNTREGDPIAYTHGQNMLLPGLEAGLAGMKTGESKQVTVSPQDGFGPVNPQAIVEVAKDKIQGEGTVAVGGILQTQSSDGSPLKGIISEVKADTVVIDFNHPLAGKELVFDVEIISVS